MTDDQQNRDVPELRVRRIDIERAEAIVTAISRGNEAGFDAVYSAASTGEASADGSHRALVMTLAAAAANNFYAANDANEEVQVLRFREQLRDLDQNNNNDEGNS